MVTLAPSVRKDTFGGGVLRRENGLAIGQIAHFSSTPLRWLPDVALRVTLNSVNGRQGDRMTQLEY